MTELHELLRDEMVQATDGLRLPSHVVSAALANTRRRLRRQRYGQAAAVTGVAAAAVAVPLLTWPGGSGSPATVVEQSAGQPTESATPAHIGYPTVEPGGRPLPANAHPPAGLRQIGVPDPAPGFPVRRLSDSLSLTGMSTGTYWADAFLVGQHTDNCVPIGPSATPSAPSPTSSRSGASTGSVSAPTAEICPPETGPEATVIVTEGPEPTSPDGNGRIEGERVTGRTTVLGHSAYITGPDARPTLYFAAGRYAVLITGDGGASVNDLVALGDSVRGLP